MTPEQVQELSSPFFQQGLLGTVAVALAYLAWFFYRSREADRKAHMLELEAKNKQINELQEKRIQEKDAISTLAIAHNRTIDELARTLNMRIPA